MDIKVGFYEEQKAKADLLVFGSFEGETVPPRSVQVVEPVAFEIVRSAIKKKRFGSKEGETFGTYHDDFKRANQILALGLGKKENWSREKFRRRVAGILSYVKAQSAKKVQILAETFTDRSVHAEEAASLISETLDRADYRFDKYLTKKDDALQKQVEAVEIVFSKKTQRKALEKAVADARIIADAVNFTRNLINEPANVMTPRGLAHFAKQVAKEGKLRCQVLGPGEIKKLRMGGVIAVSQGSHEPAQFIILEYGGSYKNKGTVCLVGKGVTFDTGGISIKPSRDMEKMKYDMSGAAAVIGIMRALSRLKIPVHVVGLAPCVENMPGGGAQRPGDIIKMYNGKSVEVINTDAEGRLILADALAYTEKFKPKAIIDMATLTGACAVTFADKCIGLMGTDPALVDKMRKGGETTSERCWELPLWDEYFEIIKGHHSDIMNAGSGYGGTITAAMFLKEFVPIKQWVHLDIAGTAWVDSDKPYNARGATGVGVRLVLEVLKNWK